MGSLPVDSVIWDEPRLSRPHAQADKSQRVRAMFDAIAPTYELVNRVLSAGRDGHWRRRAVALTAIERADRVLDVACGTGDFARAFAKAEPARIVGSDFSEKMLALAVGREDNGIKWCRADALALPFCDESFSVVSCAFGVRNFHSLGQGLREAYRVLRRGGRAVILEFSMPRSRWAGRLYLFYFQRILPRVASWISRDRTGAYRYLPSSVSSFVDGEGMVRELREAGFDRVECRSLTMGIVTVYLAWKGA
jgi:demethylmenaquinone methyltransferase/2-methoxy-6-polyprenyl-1,4-benzoquinol methylase